MHVAATQEFPELLGIRPEKSPSGPERSFGDRVAVCLWGGLSSTDIGKPLVTRQDLFP
jgi:hypothetical protein